ncbi:MAG: hypothetical protein NVS4B2_14900 [Chloroflexota bacterium]
MPRVTKAVTIAEAASGSASMGETTTQEPAHTPQIKASAIHANIMGHPGGSAQGRSFSESTMDGA